MAIRFICQCGKKLKAPDEKIGKKVLCSTCGATLVVPESDTTTVETVTMDEKSGSVANLAGDLLKRTVAESKKRNAAPQEVYDDSGIDVAELLQFVALRVAPGVLVVVLLFLGTFWFSKSMMLSKSKLPELGRVRGVITMDSQPLEHAIVSFQPIDGQKGSGSVGKTDANGRFTLTYVRDIDGAVLGKHLVAISRIDGNGFEKIPFRYNHESKVIEEVKSGTNDFKYDLRSAQ